MSDKKHITDHLIAQEKVKINKAAETILYRSSLHIDDLKTLECDTPYQCEIKRILKNGLSVSVVLAYSPG